MAPRSSTVARVSRNVATAGGMRFLKKLYTPMANAMSVAMGMAQPAAMPPGAMFSARYTPMGASMPPSAPTHGSSAARKLLSEPNTNSRLISRPTLKKKSAMRPSLTHSCALRCRPSDAGPMWKCSQNPMNPPDIALFASIKDTAVAARSRTDPRPLSSATCTSKSRLYHGVGAGSMKSTAFTLGAGEEDATETERARLSREGFVGGDDAGTTDASVDELARGVKRKDEKRKRTPVSGTVSFSGS